MNFEFSEEQIAIRDAINAICSKFDDHYWLTADQEHRFPQEFVDELVKGNWLGIAMPEAYGGSGLGITETAIMAQAISQSGAGMTGCSAIHLNLFGPNPMVVFGTEKQKETHLPRLIKGLDRSSFAVTEPDSGLNTLGLKTKAVKTDDGYLFNGRKVFTTNAQTSNKMLIIARTKSQEDCVKPVEGLSLFYTDLNRDYIEVHEIPKMGRHAIDTNSMFIDNMPVPQEDLIGEEGKGFQYLIHGLNPERCLVAAEAIGLGKAALRKAAGYANEREVFDRPIGMNQGIQHPLAVNWMELEAAELMVYKAASLYDAGLPCGLQANAAKYLAAEAAFNACSRAIMTHGGMGYTSEFHVERYLREAMISRLAPVSQELVQCFIAEKALGLPKSY